MLQSRIGNAHCREQAGLFVGKCKALEWVSRELCCTTRERMLCCSFPVPAERISFLQLKINPKKRRMVWVRRDLQDCLAPQVAPIPIEPGFEHFQGCWMWGCWFFQCCSPAWQSPSPTPRCLRDVCWSSQTLIFLLLPLLWVGVWVLTLCEALMP